MMDGDLSSQHCRLRGRLCIAESKYGKILMIPRPLCILSKILGASLCSPNEPKLPAGPCPAECASIRRIAVRAQASMQARRAARCTDVSV